MAEHRRYVNTPTSYGAVAKTFHWLTAFLILTAMPLGLAANNWPVTSLEAIQTKFLLFSLHKTVGVSAFAVASLRIVWAAFQPKPRLLQAPQSLEARLAEIIHWLLYISLVMVPLSGWLHHAATEGFAPIWWPFGQGLPFVPTDAALALLFSAWHWVFTKLLALSIALHAMGALKHHLVDRDDTLRRMLPGAVSPTTARQRPGYRPAIVAAVLYATAMLGGTIWWASQPDAGSHAESGRHHGMQITVAPQRFDLSSKMHVEIRAQRCAASRGIETTAFRPSARAGTSRRLAHTAASFKS